MRMQRSFGNAWCAGVLLGGALLLFTVGAASGATLTPAQVTAKVNSALARLHGALETAVLDIFDGVPADEADRVAADIPAAAKGATVAQRTAVGKAQATHASALTDEGQFKAARAVVAAMESAPAQGDHAALAAYEEMASLNAHAVPTDPLGTGLSTPITSPE